MERLSSLDGVFLAVEDPLSPMNIGSVAIFAGSVPPLEEVRDLLSGRIALVPRCRQRLREPPGPVGRPVWIDDVGFDPRSHVHGRSLVECGSGDLAELVAELLASPLDRSRPLWQVWVVEDPAEDRWAIVALVHHCMADGIAGSDLLGAILADSPEASASTPVPWVPSPEPSARAVVWFGLRTAARSAVAHLRGAARMLGHPRRSWCHARDVVGAAKQLWYRQVHAPTSLVGAIGAGRRWTSLDVPLDDVRATQASLGCTVNDVAVAAVSCGFRDLLVERGEDVESRTVTAMVPVSLRLPSERGEAGNRVANVHASLPVSCGDPRATLRAVHEHLEELKRSHEVEATGLLLGIGDYVPRFVADRVARAVVRRQRNVETVITNVPGPSAPLYLGPYRMIEGYPVAPIAGLVRVTVAVWSYCDHLYFGITGDRDTVSDIEVLREGIASGFARLHGVALSSDPAIASGCGEETGRADGGHLHAALRPAVTSLDEGK